MRAVTKRTGVGTPGRLRARDASRVEPAAPYDPTRAADTGLAFAHMVCAWWTMDVGSRPRCSSRRDPSEMRRESPSGRVYAQQTVGKKELAEMGPEERTGGCDL